MRSPGTTYSHFKKKVKMYDTEKKVLIAEFDDPQEAAKYAGMSYHYVTSAIKQKTIVSKNKLGLKLAFR